MCLLESTCIAPKINKEYTIEFQNEQEFSNIWELELIFKVTDRRLLGDFLMNLHLERCFDQILFDSNDDEEEFQHLYGEKS
jgi:hypothetical protein